MNSLKNWCRIHRNIDFVKKFRRNLSLAVLIALVLIKKSEYMGKSLGVGKPTMKSWMKIFQILTTFVMSRTPNFSQNGPINTWIAINLDRMIIFSLNLALVCFLGWENRWWRQNSKFLNLDPFCDVIDPQFCPKMVQKSPRTPIKWSLRS